MIRYFPEYLSPQLVCVYNYGITLDYFICLECSPLRHFQLVDITHVWVRPNLTDKGNLVWFQYWQLIRRLLLVGISMIFLNVWVISGSVWTIWKILPIKKINVFYSSISTNVWGIHGTLQKHSSAYFTVTTTRESAIMSYQQCRSLP